MEERSYGVNLVCLTVLSKIEAYGIHVSQPYIVQSGTQKNKTQ